jgi:hypothetical protein
MPERPRENLREAIVRAGEAIKDSLSRRQRDRRLREARDQAVLDAFAAGLSVEKAEQRPAVPKRRLTRNSGEPRAVSKDQIERAKAHYNELLDKDETRWKVQGTAATYIATEFLKLPETKSQTVEDWIVIPVLIERGIKPPGRSNKK